MKYVNLETGKRIDLSDLTTDEKKFYSLARKKLQGNVDWLSFDEFAFGMSSPIYSGKKSHLDVLKSPLYLALKDMSLQLGVQQGKVARKAVAVQQAPEGAVALA
jgi:hypothetical protein